jgi:putative ABC transport system ATP-binding protein
MIVLSNLTFGYSDEALLIRGASYSFERGGFYVIQGPSGVGKSTLLRLLNRLEEPVEGEISFQGRRLSSYDPPELRKSLLYVPQTPIVIDDSVRVNLLLPFTFQINSHLPKPDKEILKGRLAQFLLSDIDLNDQARSLSVGQLQRLCLIRGLLLSPKVLLLDEPTSALDPASRHVVQAATERFCRGTDATVIVVAHQPISPLEVEPVFLQLVNKELKESTWDRNRYRSEPDS